MIDASFVLTIFFLLLGPIKILAPFARLTRDAEPRFGRELAVRGTLAATVICALVVVLSETFVANYRLSVDAVRITGGVILLISALKAVFPRGESSAASDAPRPPRQLAISPLATPVIVTPAGIAAMMLFVLLAEQIPGGYQTIVGGLVAVMVLNFLVMFFNHPIVKLPGLMVGLQLVGTVLTVVQVALAVQVLLAVFRALGLLGRA